jgi:hypothetical protein
LIAQATAHPESRQRLSWIFGGFFPYLCGVAFINITFAANAAWFWYTPGSLTVALYFLRAMELALPVSLFNGVVLRRTLDIGFVFNRVAIYGILSILLVAIFALLEYAVGRLMDASRTDRC